MTDVRRASVLAAVRLYAQGARPDVVTAQFAALGIDVQGNPEHLRAVASLAVALRVGEAVTEEALTVLGCAA